MPHITTDTVLKVYRAKYKVDFQLEFEDTGEKIDLDNKKEEEKNFIRFATDQLTRYYEQMFEHIRRGKGTDDDKTKALDAMRDRASDEQAGFLEKIIDESFIMPDLFSARSEPSD